MDELHIIDYKSFKSSAGKDVRLLSLWYKQQDGFCQALTLFVPKSYNGADPKPGAVMHGLVLYGKDGPYLRSLDK